MSKEVLINKENTEKVDRPTLGKIQFILSCNFQCISFLLGKILYERYPQLDPTTLLVYRSAVSCLVLILWHNIHLKYIMWDCI
jgi:hypothetical protein